MFLIFDVNRASKDNVRCANANQITRLRSSKTIIRFRTVESPAQALEFVSPTQVSPTPPQQDDHPPLPRTRTPKHRHCYSFKRREKALIKKRDPPAKMKQFVFKPHKEQKPRPEKAKDKASLAFPPKTLSSSKAPMDKLQVTRLLAYHHPTSSLFVGTLSANVKRALPGQRDLQQEVMTVIQQASSEAARVKRQGQTLIGKYIEKLVSFGIENLDLSDRTILGLLCQPVSMSDVKYDEDEDDDDGEEEEEEDGTGLEGSKKSRSKHKEQLPFQLP